MSRSNYDSIGVGLHEDHNAGIAAVQGGEVILYCEFERLTRIKNQSGRFPELTTKYLSQLPLEKVDVICAPDPSFVISLLADRFDAIPVSKSAARVGDHIIEVYGQSDFSHPIRHVLAGMPLEGFSPGVYAILIFDAEQPRFGWIDLREPLIQPPEIQFFTVSDDKWFNGELFSDLFGKLFYGSYNLSHCGKLMGLSSWGRNRVLYIDWLKELAQRHFDPLSETWRGYRSASKDRIVQEMADLLGVNPDQHTHSHVLDLAASAQEMFTDMLGRQVVIGMKRIRQELQRSALPEPRGLIYGGGCALSVVSNALLRNILDMPILIPPYANDASQFLGAAVWASLKASPGTWQYGRWKGIPCHTVGQVKADQLTAFGVLPSAAHPDEIAKRIASGQLIALIEGGAEAGPRALGKRSLLANALDPNMRDRINHEVKKREWYRPFAPALPADTFTHYFEEPASGISRYMLDAFRVIPHYRSLLASVSSPDGTSRPQAVDPKTSPWYYDLLIALGSQTGHPIVLNTSLNAPGLPIAFDLSQSLRDCWILGVDAAVVDGLLLEREAIARIAQ